MRLFLLLLIVFSLSSCSKLEVDDAGVTNPENISLERTQFKILNTEAREALNAKHPDALIAVFGESGVTFYGAPGKDFRLEPEEQLTSRSPKASKADDKGPVNDLVIRTYANSPLCQEIYLGGGRVWYPSGCPH
ncbi:MAG: hypothetical protein WBO73_06395 [Gammaproteobacteria bacterium]|jgi:hypothetical protein